MLDTIEPVKRRAIAIVAIQMLMSIGMLGVVLPPAGAPERVAAAPTPADHAAIAAQAIKDQQPTF